MIVLERQFPNNLLLLEVLLRRLSKDDINYDYYKDLYIRVKKGYEGELVVDKVWKELFVPTNFYLLHNFETMNEVGHTHQIDTMFICPNFILIVEIKNISGRIEIESNKHQLIRIKGDGSSQGFSNPIDQVIRHVNFLNRFLTHLHINLPIEYAIVLTKDSTVIGDVPANIPIFKVSGLTTYLNELYKKYPNSGLTPENLEMIVSRLLEILRRKTWLPKINLETIRKGAVCRKCNEIMEFKRGRFVCSVCNWKSIDILYEGLNDYRLLFKPWITNREFTDFFLISSSKTSNRLLTQLNFRSEGRNKGRKYYIPEDISSYKI